MRRTGLHSIGFTVRCESGLHIGGSSDELKIGGADNPVIKNPANDKPYIPGSSFKGKMRHELERELGKQGSTRRERDNGMRGSLPCGCARDDCPVCRVFGAHLSTRSALGPSRIMVRDGRLVEGGALENKTENVINRASGAAEHPRSTERVVEGSEFQMNIVLQVFEDDRDFSYTNRNGHPYQGDEALQAIVADCLRMVQLTGIGGGTSRGSGAVSFHNITMNGEPWTHWSG